MEWKRGIKEYKWGHLHSHPLPFEDFWFLLCGPHFGYHVDKCSACIWFDSYNQIQAPVLTRHHIKLGMLRVKAQGVQTRVYNPKPKPLNKGPRWRK